MLLWSVLSIVLLAIKVQTQTTLSGTTTTRTRAASISSSSSYNFGDTIPTGTEVTYPGNSDATLPAYSYGSMTISSSSIAANNSSSAETISSSTTSNSITLLVGSSRSTLSSGSTLAHNATRTSASVQATNTRACNGHAALCDRKWSNITHVAAHNSPFVTPNNAASNQAFSVEYQLNDGIRMLQSESHLVNNTIHMCHTSCELLNAGTLEDYLTTIRIWLDHNRFEVLTILLVNSNLVDPGNYTAPFQNSGILQYVYSPPKTLMGIYDWPSLTEMILTQKRVIVMLDYQANQTAIPWLIDEFSVMWETPFSPQNRSFPCTLQRPPGLLERDAVQRLYMANHNLNTEINLLGSSILVPTTPLLNETNAASPDVLGSLGAAAVKCTGKSVVRYIVGSLHANMVDLQKHGTVGPTFCSSTTTTQEAPVAPFSKSPLR